MRKLFGKIFLPDVTFPILGVLFVAMDEMEVISLTPEQERDTTDRDDDLGRLFAVAFAAVKPPFLLRLSAREGGKA